MSTLQKCPCGAGPGARPLRPAGAGRGRGAAIPLLHIHLCPEQRLETAQDFRGLLEIISLPCIRQPRPVGGDFLLLFKGRREGEGLESLWILFLAGGFPSLKVLN